MLHAVQPLQRGGEGQLRSSIPGAANKPGARRAGIDFSYRLPGLRNLATFYADGLAQHDEVLPLLGPDVASWSAGLYLPK